MLRKVMIWEGGGVLLSAFHGVGLERRQTWRTFLVESAEGRLPGLGRTFPRAAGSVTSNLQQGGSDAGERSERAAAQQQQQQQQ